MTRLLILLLLAVALAGCNWQPTDQKVCVHEHQYRVWYDKTGMWTENMELRRIYGRDGKPAFCTEAK